MDFRSVRYFEEVAEAGSLRAAAERLRVAGSAISRTIAILEAELGVELFDRSRTGMALTPAGQIYLNYARGVRLELERLRAEIQALQGLRHGHVRVASVEGAVSALVIRAIRKFVERFPAITFSLRVGGADLVSEAVSSRSADIGVGASGLYADYGDEIAVTFRAAAPLCAIMSPQLTGSVPHRPLSLAELAATVPVAVPDDTFAIRRQLDECAGKSGLRLTPVLVTNSVDALRAFARTAAGATFLPSLAVQDDLASGLVVAIPLTDPLLNDSSIDLLVANGRHLPPASSEFVGYLANMVAEDAT